MHLVIDCRSIHKHMGGIGRVAWSLVDHLARAPRGHKITALLGAEPPQGIAFPGVGLVQADAAMIDPSFEQIGLPGLLEDLQADLYLNPCFSIPALKTSTYQVPIVHDIVFEEQPQWVEPGLREYLQRWTRFAVQHADRIITVSDHARGRILNAYGTLGADRSRVVRIYNGIPEDAFDPPRPEDVARVRSRYGIDPRRGSILYLGTLEPKKGVPELLAAFGRLAGTGLGPEIRGAERLGSRSMASFDGDLVLAGGRSGPAFDLDGAVARTGRTDRVRVIGYVDEKDKKALIAACDLFVYPSHYEGFGLPPLEAMALGVPCVTSNATSIPEVVGDAAITVDVKDPYAFARALDHGLKDRVFHERAKTAGPERARKFSWDRAAGEYLDLVESLGN